MQGQNSLRVWSEWTEVLACPACQGSLVIEDDRIECQKCRKTYAIRNGIPYFVEEEELDDFEVGESQFHSLVAPQADHAHAQATLRAEVLHDAFLAPIYDLPAEAPVLDVACGSGVDIVRLAARGFRVVGMDISPGMIAVAQQKMDELGLSGQVLLCVSSARALPFRSGCFQAAYICAALHHMQEPQAVLRDMARVTRAGGLVSVGSEPNAWIYRFRGLKHSKLGRRIMRLFRNDYTIGEQPPGDAQTEGWTRADWPALIRDTGLELVRVDPIWYLNGVASLLGMRALPRWFERALCSIDRVISAVPVVNQCSMKWNVLARAGAAL
ncbi:MAG: methyltransferase domain-containing protein [Anaerolineales bacterium]|nr:methyltransferase domain-containing protein [Anaerolineales bacterium]